MGKYVIYRIIFIIISEQTPSMAYAQSSVTFLSKDI